MTTWVADTGSAWTAGSERFCSGRRCTEPAVAERRVEIAEHVRAGRSSVTLRNAHSTVSHGRVYGYCAEHLVRLGRRVHDGRLQVAIPTGRTA